MLQKRSACGQMAASQAPGAEGAGGSAWADRSQLTAALAGLGSWCAEGQALEQRTPACLSVVPECWQGENSLPAREGSWKWEYQDLGGLLPAWVTREAALGKSSLLFPSSPTSASCSCTTVPQRAPAMPHGV